MQTYRYLGHSMSDPAKYRSREEVSKVRSERDPIDRARQYVMESNAASEEDLKQIDADVKAIVSDAAEFSQQSPVPEMSELYTDILIEA
jgi:pyruvate dehydrogenase E1 component alpha subunit